MSLARDHAEWRTLVEVSGPFLSIEILCRAFPQGLDKLAEEGALRARLRAAHEEWQEEGARPAIHQAWLRFVLDELLELDDEWVRRGQDIPGQLEVALPEHGERLRPDAVLIDPTTNRPLLLVQVV